MTTSELATLFKESRAIVNGGVTPEDAIKAAGGVPLYMKAFLEDPVKFEEAIYDEVGSSIRKLEANEVRWCAQKKSIIYSVLKLSTLGDVYDKKYLISVRGDIPGRCLYLPLFPAALTAYRRHLWDEIMQYVRDEE
jgi:hypothetical protein